MTDETHDPSLTSWAESANDPATDFPIQNLPFGTLRDGSLVIRIGDHVLDAGGAFGLESMRAVMAMPRPERIELRRRISRFLAKRTPGAEAWLRPLAEVELALPCEIGDYTDFYASVHHATNVGRMFRPDHPLLPN
jgi:fumarylacetoacetase